MSDMGVTNELLFPSLVQSSSQISLSGGLYHSFTCLNITMIFHYGKLRFWNIKSSIIMHKYLDVNWKIFDNITNIFTNLHKTFAWYPFTRDWKYELDPILLDQDCYWIQEKHSNLNSNFPFVSFVSTHNLSHNLFLFNRLKKK